MTLLHRTRLFFLIIRELGQKYTKSLLLGFVTGLALSIGFWRLGPYIRYQWFTPVDRIGVVGEFTPSELPLHIQNEISHGLTTIADDRSIKPGLATEWRTSDQGKVFVFTIKKDARWHNGKQITARDVNYNINGVTFEAVDDYTLKVTLKASYSPFLAVVSKPLFLTGFTGWGPYRVTSVRLHGDKVSQLRLVPLKESSKAKEYYFYRTEAEAILAYKLGEINILYDLSAPADLSHWGRTVVETSPNDDRIVSLYFNVSNSFLSDRAIRQGLAYASPVPKHVQRAYSPISRTSWAYYEKVKKYPYDIDAAKKLLPTPDGSTQSAKLTISTFAPFLEEAEAIAQSWSDLGIQSNVKVITSVTPDYQVLLSAQDLPPDPDQYPFWHSTQTATNITNYVNVKIDKLLEDGRQETDSEKRKTIYHDFQRYLTDDVPAAFLHYQTRYTISRR